MKSRLDYTDGIGFSFEREFEPVQDGKGIWNNFGGKMDWDARAIVSDDRKFAGRGGPSSGDPFPAAPNIDHTQTFVKADIKEWLQWMRDYMGFDGWR